MTLTRRYSVPESLSIPDENINDLVAGGLYLREWAIVGTPPPSPDSATVEHLVLNYHQATEDTDPSEIERVTPRPIVLDRDTQLQIEEIPVLRDTLGQYEKYFADCVVKSRSDMVLNICKVRKKSPCVDIPGCLVVKPSRDMSLISDDYCKVKVGDQDCILMIPQTVIDNVIENVAYTGKYVVSVPHDAWPYNSSRVRISQLYTDFQPEDSDWDSTSTYLRDLQRYVSCSAVSTATLTVTFVLGTCWGKYSYYRSRKSLSIVVHAIK